MEKIPSMKKMLDLLQSAKGSYIKIYERGNGFIVTHGRYRTFIRPTTAPTGSITVNKYINIIGSYLGYAWWNFTALYQGWEVEILTDPYETKPDESPETLRERTRLSENEKELEEERYHNISEDFEEEEED